MSIENPFGMKIVGGVDKDGHIDWTKKSDDGLTGYAGELGVEGVAGVGEVKAFQDAHKHITGGVVQAIEERAEAKKIEQAPPPETEKTLILKQYGGLESNIPLNSPYWRN